MYQLNTDFVREANMKKNSTKVVYAEVNFVV